MSIEIDERTANLLSQVLRELERARDDGRPLMREFVKKLDEGLNDALNDILRNNIDGAKKKFEELLQRSQFVRKGLGSGLHAEEYLRVWLQSLITTSGVLISVTLVALTLISRNLQWQVSLSISTLIFVSTFFLIGTIWYSFRSHARLTYTIRHPEENEKGYVDSVKLANRSKKLFLIALVLLIVAIFLYVATFIPILRLYK